MRLPYPGLRPFHPEESDIFFGREKQTDDLLDKIGANRFLAITGPSGCGKSSLVRAGLIAALQTGFMAPGKRWQIAIMRPGSEPIENLARALLGIPALSAARSRGDAGSEELAALLRRGPLGLVEILRRHPLPEGTNLLILADQFEEIFRFPRSKTTDEARAYVNLMIESSVQQEIPDVFVAITIRSDYLGDCAAFEGLPEVLNRSLYLTPRLTREQRCEAILSPARVFGADIEPNLLNRLVNESGSDPDQLPVLQHLMMRMWTYRDQPAAALPVGNPPELESNEMHGANGRVLTLADYESVGGFNGALSQHAEQAYQQLDARQQKIAELIFRRLCERGGDRRDVRCPTPLSDLSTLADSILGNAPVADIQTVIEVFRHPGYGFLATSNREAFSPETVVDIIHESLIRRWNRLDAWVEEESNSAKTYRYLEQAARRWKKREGALWGSPDLENALAWREKDRPTRLWAARYGGDFELAEQFLEESRKRQERNQSIEEQNRQGQLKARWSEEMLSARFLARAAKNALNTDPEKGLLLAIEALKLQIHRDPSERVAYWDAQEALHEALQASRIRATLPCEESYVNAVGFSRAGDYIAAGGSDGRVRAWEASSGRLILDRLSHDAPINSLVFNLVGSAVITAGADGFFAAVNIFSGQELYRTQTQSISLNGIDLSNDGARLTTAGADGSVKSWDAFHGGYLGEIMRYSAWEHFQVGAVSSNPLDGTLAMGIADGWIVIAQPEPDGSFREIHRFPAHGAGVRSMSFSPDGSIMASADSGGAVHLWDAQTWRHIRELKSRSGGSSAVSFSPDGRHIAVACADRTARVFDRETREELLVLTGHGHSVNGVAFSPDGSLLATASADRTVKVWDASAAASDYCTITDFGAEVNQAAFCGGSIISASADGKASIWDLSLGKMIHVFDAHASAVNGLAVDRKSSRLATAGADRLAKIWDLESRELLGVLTGHDQEVNAIVYGGPADEWIATAGADWSIRIWNAQTFEAHRVILRAHENAVTTIAWTPVGNLLASGDEYGKVKLWDAATGDNVCEELSKPVSAIRNLAFSPDGAILAVAGLSEIKLWIVGARQIYRTFSSHIGLVRGIAFSPDGRRLGSVGDDRTARIWDIDTGQELMILGGHTNTLASIAYSADGNFLATASSDKTVRIYALDPEELLQLAQSRVTRNLTEEERQTLRIPGASPVELILRTSAG